VKLGKLQSAWLQLRRLWDELSRDHVDIISAGVSFYAFLALVPTLAALIFVYGLVFDPADVPTQVAMLKGFVPREVTSLLERELARLVSASGGALGVGAVASAMLAIWSSSKSSRALMEALNIIHEYREQRPLVSLYGLSLVFTCSGLIAVVLTLAAMVALPEIAEQMMVPQWVVRQIDLARFLFTPVLVLFAVSVLYRYGPSHPNRQYLPFLSWGALLAAVLWMIGSWLFHVYVDQMTSYGSGFGSIGAVVVSLLWLYLSTYVILLGAELDAVVFDRRRRRDRAQGRPPQGATDE
jgi:membrane protein